MSQGPPQGVAPGDAVRGAEALTPERVEGVLADFRAWLLSLKDEGGRMKDETGAAGVHPSSFILHPSEDLHTLVAQFTALRHEVHLQTRAARAQQEQGAEALRQFGETLAALQQSQLSARLGEEQARDEALRPLLKVLVDVHDALALAEREVARTQETLLPLLEPAPAAPQPEPDGAPAAPPPSVTPSFWARVFGLGRTIADQQATIALLHRQLTEERARRPAPEAPQAAGRARQMLAAILTGYTMSKQRVERALREHGLEPIPAVGEPFDPEQMEVLEVVTDSGRPSGEVVGEVRRGYLWRGRVFRFAQVRVAKS
jgi:molecular chaperone GrpE